MNRIETRLTQFARSLVIKAKSFLLRRKLSRLMRENEALMAKEDVLLRDVENLRNLLRRHKLYVSGEYFPGTN
jgi:hypothetical protein